MSWNGFWHALAPFSRAQLPNRQTSCTIHQIVKLTYNIEESVEKRQKAGIVLVDFTAACTFWHQGLTP